MRRLILGKKGQSTLEYAIIISMVIAGLSVMGLVWFRGAYQGRLKSASDDIGEQFDIDHTLSSWTTSRTSTTTETLSGTSSIVDTEEDISRWGTDTTDALADRE